MKVSRAELAARSQERIRQNRRVLAASRTTELISLLAASLCVLAGLFLVYSAKAQDGTDEEKTTLNLNQLTGAQQLLPYLGFLPTQAEQDFVAARIYNVKRHGEHFDNVGAIARLRVTETEVARMRGLTSISARLAEAQRRKEQRAAERGWLSRFWPSLHGSTSEVSVPLLTAAEFASLKPAFRVREVDDYRRSMLLWPALFFAAFYATHVLWRMRGFAGDHLFLPVMHVLSGLGLILMISLRDPLRDTLMFTDFTVGVIAGCAALFLFSIPDYQRQFSRLSYVPLFAAFLLALALGLFGRGPGVSDAKVNLLFFQPVEIIRLLLVFFLAGYFAQNWDALRHLRQPSPANMNYPKWISIPRLDYVLPVAAGVAVSIALFFWLSDLGPALVIGCLFLTMYSISRNSVVLAAAGLAVIILAFVIGYETGYPHTVRERVEMWKSPWDNHVHGGDQLADSLWSLSTGATTGTGFGLGDSQTMPAAHTDLIISAFGKQAGLLGIVALYGLYGLLIWRSIRIALSARGTYSFFLVAGLALIACYQLLLISEELSG